MTMASSEAIQLAEATRKAREAEHANNARAVRSRFLLLTPAMFVILAVSVLPLSVVVYYSFMQPAEFAGVIHNFSWDAWINLLFERDLFTEELGPNDAYYTIYLRSIGMAALTTVMTLLVGFPTAYFITTRPQSTRNTWLFLITLPFWTNLLIRIYSIMMIVRDEGYINNILINLGFVDRPVQILFTNWAVAYGQIYTYLPYMVLPLYASVEKLDFRLVEAAYDLYANRWQVLRRVILPLVKPGIIAGCTLVFIPSIGDYTVARVLGGGKKMMLGNLIAEQFGGARNWPQGSALALALMLVVLVALFIYARQVARGAAVR